MHGLAIEALGMKFGEFGIGVELSHLDMDMPIDAFEEIKKGRRRIEEVGERNSEAPNQMQPEEFQLVLRRIALPGQGRDETLHLGVIIDADSGISAAARQVASVYEIVHRIGPVNLFDEGQQFREYHSLHDKFLDTSGDEPDRLCYPT